MINKLNPTIAVIDSGIGGVSILRQLINKYERGNYIYFADNLYMPYGNKSKNWVKTRIDYIINLLQNKYKLDYIIIACNTASASIDINQYKNVKTMNFNTKKTYFATQLTKENLKNAKVIADKTLAKQIGHYIFNINKLESRIKHHIKLHKLNELKSYVLGCTRYELVDNIFKKYCPNSEITNNSSYVINDLTFNYDTNELNMAVIVTKNSENYKNKILKLIRG